MTLRKFGTAFALSTSLLAAPLAAQDADLLIRNVTVIDPQQGATLSAQDVVIDEGRIIVVAPSGEVAPAAATVIDGTGKFLIPGLMDMHVHTSIRPVHTNSLKLMIAHGVTGVREMGSDCVEPGTVYMCLAEMRQSAAAIEAGEMVGPRLLSLATFKVNSNRRPDASEGQVLYSPVSAEDARATVAGLAARGPNLIKVSQEFHPDAFEALVRAAGEADIEVGGHIPMMFSVADVAKMGMTTIEHARDLPLDCSIYGPVFRNQIMRKIRGEDVAWPDRAKQPGRVADTFDEALCAPHIQAMAQHGTWYVPTHLTREMDYRAGDPSYRDDPRLAWLPAMQVADWTRDLDRTAKAPQELVADLEAFFQLGLRTTKLAHSAGVRIMAGTDANDTMVFPGSSLHDELGFFVQAGLTPMEALQTATSTPAEYLELTDDFGGIAPGKMADLVLLRADPLADIANTASIEMVVQGGRVHDRAALDAMLVEVKESAAAMGPPR